MSEEEKKDITEGITLEEETEEVNTGNAPLDAHIERQNRKAFLELEIQQLENQIMLDEEEFSEKELAETVEYLQTLNDRITENKALFNQYLKEYKELNKEERKETQGTSFFEYIPFWEYAYSICMAILGIPWVLTMLSYYIEDAIASSWALWLQYIMLFLLPILYIVPTIVLLLKLKEQHQKKFMLIFGIISAIEWIITLVIMLTALF